MVAISEARTDEIARELLTVRGWNSAQPPRGQLLLQNEYRNYPYLLDALKGKGKAGRGGDGFPDFIVINSDGRPMIVGEAKADHNRIGTAITEASEIYGEALFAKGYPVLAVGIAGHQRSNIAIQIKKRDTNNWRTVNFQETPIQWIPGPDEALDLLSDKNRFDLTPRVPSQEILARYGEKMNEIFRSCKISDALRPAAIGAFMLAVWFTKGDIRTSPAHVLEDINRACKEAFRMANKSSLANSILLQEANVALANAAPQILHMLHLLGIATLNHAHDYIGQLYESFFRFTGGNTIGQYFTPRHIVEFMTGIVQVSHSDFVIDPTCGTGGFLVSSLYKMTEGRGLTHAQISKHVEQHLRGFESEPITAALCVVNMIMRGDGKTGIFAEDCFTSPNYPKNEATVSLGNPPFPHKKSDDKPEKFVNRALEALKTRGKLAFILPASMLVKADKKNWRSQILKNHTLRGVISLPDELFQPYAAATTAIVIIEKGIPHSAKTSTFFCRVSNDGLKLRKGVRIKDVGGQLEKAEKYFHLGESEAGFCIMANANAVDWSPGSFIESRDYPVAELKSEINELLRIQAAFHALHADKLVELRSALEANLLDVQPYSIKSKVTGKEVRALGSLFSISYGQGELETKHSLGTGCMPIISSAGSDNGCCGFYDFSHRTSLIKPPFVTVPRTGSIGFAHVQHWPCGATSDCILLIPKPSATIEDMYIASAVIRLERWRFNYGRKITPSRITDVEISGDPTLRHWITKRLKETDHIEDTLLKAYGENPATGDFKDLAAAWKSSRSPVSTIKDLSKHPAYKEIIRMGHAAIPLILSELKQEADHWFSALYTITGANPVPKRSEGKLNLMAEAWLKWGREQGYTR